MKDYYRSKLLKFNGSKMLEINTLQLLYLLFLYRKKIYRENNLLESESAKNTSNISIKMQLIVTIRVATR